MLPKPSVLSFWSVVTLLVTWAQVGSSEGRREIAPSRIVEKGLLEGETRKGRLISGEGMSRRIAWVAS